MVDIDSMTKSELLDHAFTHVMSGEYHPDSTCCDDARTEILRRMGNDPVPAVDQLDSNVIYERSMAQVPPHSNVNNPPGCDYQGVASQDGQGGCRCGKCGRCDRHTGNSTQGHYWSFCDVTKNMRDFHFCCPGACELEMKEGR